ncbi:dentin sialophosphoprotein-like [Argiope bruennichi]|uniref:dentin sialophosphoprotein-like n=1 Tax=Argiope bruennichi TaxID=94029 RepID=UPI0024941F04|nr:dentin sialophosphoprotein-like [Argiope bruennichi]
MLQDFGAIVMVIMVVKIETTVEQEAGDGCDSAATLALIPKDDWMEAEVIMGFRVWQLMFLALAGLITVVVLLCCFMKCRVPRTKQEIEADFKRKEITRRFRFLLDRVQIEDTSLRTAIEKVNELYTNREKMKRRKKKKADDEEETLSVGSSYLFVDEKLTIKERIKKLLGLLDDNVSDTDSMKETTDKSDDQLKRSTSGDELSSLPEVKIVEINKSRQVSEESSDSPKLGDSHSKLSFLQDSPPRTHDTLSRLSLLQDSPPNYGVTLLEDTPPSHQAKKSDQESAKASDSGRSKFDKKKTESQESQDSEHSVKKQDSTDSDINSHKLKQKSDSQGSDDKKVKQSKSDSQDSENGKSRKQKSDSQESNDSFDNLPKVKNKRIFEPHESKLTRRESMGGYSGIDASHKWRKSPNAKTKSESKVTKSLDVNTSSHFN